MNQRGEYGNARSGQDYYYDAAAVEYVGGERGERGERGGRGRSWRGWGGRGWRGGGWPYYSSYALPYYSSSFVPSYSYALPAYDITDGGYVYPMGQSYVPSYGYGLPSYALPFYGAAATVFPHWRSRRHFLHRHRRRIYDILGAEVD